MPRTQLGAAPPASLCLRGPELCCACVLSFTLQSLAALRGGEEQEEQELRTPALVFLASAVAGSWGLAGVAAGTAWWRLEWEGHAFAALSSLPVPSIPVCKRTCVRIQ